MDGTADLESLASARQWTRGRRPIASGTGTAVAPDALTAATPARAGSALCDNSWRNRRLRPSWGATVPAGAALVLAIGFIDHTARGAPTLRAVVETIQTLLALAAAVLVSQQFADSRRLWKLLLLGALVLLALTEFLADALPAAMHVRSGTGFTAAVPLGQLIIAAALVAAARTPPDTVLIRLRRPILITAAASMAAFAVAEGGGLLLRSWLVPRAAGQAGIEPTLDRPLGFAMLLASVALFGWAAAEFTRRGRVEKSQMLSLLGCGALLLGAARLYYLALPSVSSGELSPREALRLVALGFIFVAALVGDQELRLARARIAAAIERRRVAQDLHDGLAQDLAFIAAHGASVASEFGDDHPVARAARRALAVSRGTISDLSDPKSGTPREALDTIAQELGARFGIRVVVDVDREVLLGATSQNQVGRIAREAIANAARHGDARNVLVSLKSTDMGTVLRVVDDGSGIESGSGMAREGFGILSMRERTAALGGFMTVRPASPTGTELEVVLP